MRHTMNKKYITTILIAVCFSLMTAEAQNVFPQDGSWFTGFSSTKPTLLDVAFNGDGTAQDVSTWYNSADTKSHQAVETFGKPTTFWNKELGRFGMKNGCTWAGDATNFYRWKYTDDEWNRLANNLTVEALVKMPDNVPDADNNEAKIIGSTQAGGFALMVYNKQIRFTIHDGTDYRFVTCPTPVEPGKMYHIVAMYGGKYDPKGVMRLYVNGKMVDEISGIGETIQQPSATSAHCVMIGADPNSKDGEAAQGFPGEIYIARIFKDNLDDSHIATLYNNIKFRNTNVTADLLDVVYDGRGYAYDVSPRKQTIKAMKALPQPNNVNYVMEEITGVPSANFSTLTKGGVWKTEFDPRYGRFTLNSDDVKHDSHPNHNNNTKENGEVPQHFYGIDYRNDYDFKLTQLNGFTMELVVNDHTDLTQENAINADEAKWFASTEEGGTAMLTGNQTTEAMERNIAFIVKTTGKDHYIGTDIETTDPMGDFGSHYAAEIGREQGNTMTQTITELPRGWYKVSCQGFVTDGGHANLMANDDRVALQSAGYDNVIQPNKTTQQQMLIRTGQKIDNCQKYNDNVAAATLFDADPTQYQNEVWVYVDNGTLTIGLEKVDDTGRAFVDNFRLVYGGDVTEIYLSATKNPQETRDKAAYTDPMRFTLRRAFSKDKWNALSLPVSISADQLKANFQADEKNKMKLYKLEGIDANRKTLIRFRKVDLDAPNSEGLLANECYVIWPTKIAQTYNENSEAYTYTFPDATSGSLQHTVVKTYNPLYHFENVTADGYGATSTKDYETSSGTLKYTAYYDRPQGGVSGQFYMVEDGVMYYATSCPWLYASYWILEDVANVNQSKDFTMLFDDETTGIGSVEGINPGERRVYNLNGQMMGTDNTNTLRKGVYIVNGKKVVIR